MDPIATHDQRFLLARVSLALFPDRIDVRVRRRRAPAEETSVPLAGLCPDPVIGRPPREWSVLVIPGLVAVACLALAGYYASSGRALDLVFGVVFVLLAGVHVGLLVLARPLWGGWYVYFVDGTDRPVLYIFQTARGAEAPFIAAAFDRVRALRTSSTGSALPPTS